MQQQLQAVRPGGFSHASSPALLAVHVHVAAVVALAVSSLPSSALLLLLKASVPAAKAVEAFKYAVASQTVRPRRLFTRLITHAVSRVLLDVLVHVAAAVALAVVKTFVLPALRFSWKHRRMQHQRSKHEVCSGNFEAVRPRKLFTRLITHAAFTRAA